MPTGFVAPQVVVERDFLRDGGLVGRGVDDVVLAHQLEDDAAALDSALGIATGLVVDGALMIPASIAASPNERSAAGLPKVAPRRRFGAVQAIAEIHLVQIDLENFVFGIEMFDPLRNDRFAPFPAQRLVAGQKAHARELLRNGACTLRRAPLAQVGHQRPDQADAVDTVVFVEAHVFDRDDGLLQIR